MLNTFKYAAITAFCVASFGCATSESDQSRVPEKYARYVEEVVPVSDLLTESSSGSVLLDLQQATTGYWFEEGIDYSAIDVLCPSGRVMNLEQWMPELATEFGVPVSELQGSFIMFTRFDGAQPEDAPICDEGCYAHRETNNTWVCRCS